MTVIPGAHGECTLWTGGVQSAGYGWFYRSSTRTWHLAHRAAFEQAHGPVPAGHQVHHRCGVKRCINPAHLEALSQREHLALHGVTGAAKVNAAKTHCVNGHRLPPRKVGQRQRTCQVCAVEANRRYRSKRRAA